MTETYTPQKRPIHQISTAHFPGKGLVEDDQLQIYQGNHLPHWERDSVIYHVTFSLIDAIPKAKRDQLQQEREWLAKRASDTDIPCTPEELRRLHYLYSDKIEEYLNNCYGSCLMRDDRVAALVKNTLEYYNEERYLLHAWCIMPNHVHAILQLINSYPLAEILRYWKSYTAHGINKLLERQGSIWHPDSYNHIIRTLKEYFNQILYVWNNPAKLCPSGWPWRWKCDNVDE